MNPIDTSMFVGKFVEEARDRLKALGAALLQLEQAPGAIGAIAEALREAHSIKGSALMLGFTDISQITHELEELFVAAKTNPVLLDGDAFDVIFRGVDQVATRVEGLARGQLEAIEVSDICRQLNGLLNAGSKTIARPSRPETIDYVPDTPADDQAPPPQKAPEVGQSLRVPVEKLDRLAHLAPEMVVQSLKAFERHTELRRMERMLSRLRDRVREARLTPETADHDRGAQLADYADALDVVTRRMRDFLVNFSDDRVRLNLITEELRQNVIELTMLPVGSVFDAFPRAVRDLARTFGKDIDITIRGRETELDKKIIEQISEPLIHLIRNAVDHGIETPADRMRVGKPAAGRLILSAEQQGNRILITLKDDGCGIDLAILRAVAIQRRVAAAGEIDRWSPEQILDVIFQPGFSTRSLATDVSGRGVGMDVVKSVVERLGGAVRVQSELDKGTSVTLNLPLSLALLRVVLVEAGEELFALPTAAIRRILQVGTPDIAQLQQGPVAEVDGENIPLTALSAMLQVPGAPVGARQTVIVAEGSDGRFGILVEAVHEEQELVFKELRGPLRNQKTFTGAALLGNGDIVPILDVNALFDLASRAPAIGAAPMLVPRATPRISRVLVVDDSLVAGELQKNILLAAGYESQIASDGIEALDCLHSKEWDLVVADVDMPRMTGFELTERIRADERFRDIPVIIVTSRDTVDDRRRGFEVGADAYVLKREFDQSQLLETVRRLIGRATRQDASHV
ncbi:MAG TPA: hybrid sensor histidine kinase/response regulator [Vicinamibacterales bacterium]|nr:hybrid sensor histidine kinase/response regulator [Vicinamibacterales bacterium]